MSKVLETQEEYIINYLESEFDIKFSHIYQTIKGNSALHLAIQKGNLKICTLLVNKDVSINLSDNKGNTPLHIACLNGNEDIVKLLL